jgi:hypothetical protein
MAIACTLTGDDQIDRIEHWRRLLAQAVGRVRLDDGLRIAFPIALAGAVAELAAAEHQCCAFFDFTLRLTGGELTLDVRAEASAAPLLAEVFGAA